MPLMGEIACSFCLLLILSQPSYSRLFITVFGGHDNGLPLAIKFFLPDY